MNGVRSFVFWLLAAAGVAGGGAWADEELDRTYEAVEAHRVAGLRDTCLQNASVQQFAEALPACLEIAQAGNVEGQNALGAIYFLGNDDVDANYKQSYIWFAIAARGGNAQYIQNRDIAKGKLSESEVREADEDVKAFRK